MQQTLSNPISRPTIPHEPSFHLFIACDDQNAFAHAKKVEQQVKTLCGTEIETARVFWSFSLLRHQPLQQHAAAEAALADMIIISLARNYELPPHVKALLEHLPHRRVAGQTALVALMNVEDSGSSAKARALAAYLRNVAETHGLEFFCNKKHTVQPGFVAPSFTRPHLRGLTPERVISHHIPWTAGGINE